MKHLELEKGVTYILDKFKQLDYETPSSRQILKAIFYKLVIAYIFQLLFIVSDTFVNPNVSEYHYFDIFVLSPGPNASSSLAFLMSTYNLVSLRLSLGSEITEQSASLKLVEREINSYSLFLLTMNVIVGCIPLSLGERFVAGPGFSRFVTCLISMLTLQTSPFRYVTPAVISNLSKMKELFSVSPK